jgi:ferrous iron transport protein B
MKNVARVLWERGTGFVKRAGTIIFAVSVLIWATLWFPHSDDISAEHETRRDQTSATFEAKAGATAHNMRPGMTIEQLENDEAVAKVIASLRALHEVDDATRAEDEENLADDPDALKEARQRASQALVATMEEIRRQNGDAFAPGYALFEAQGQRDDALAEIDNDEARAHAENSWLGRVGHVIEPAVRPLGWVWRIGMAAVASFPAREVIVGTLGTIFSLGDIGDEDTGLRERLQTEVDAEGKPLFTLATGLSVMVFFALCCQCAATLAVMRRETNSWKWPAASFVYMTGLAYVCALITYQVAHALGG